MLLEVYGELPEKWRNIPEPDPQYQWVFSAFFDLSTCRQVGMGVGPIPWTAIQQYVTTYFLDDDQAYFLKRVVYGLDKVYLRLLKE